MTNLVNLPLGAAGIKYIEKSLDQLGGMAPAMLRVLPSGGTVFAPLPDDVSLARAERFSTGEIIRRRDTLAWLGNCVTASVKDMQNGTFVVQDVWGMRPSDPVAAKVAVPHFFNGDTVHYYLLKNEITPETVADLFGMPASFLVVAALAAIDIASDDVPANNVAERAFMTRLVDHVQEIFISAYDGEGLVVWRRS